MPQTYTITLNVLDPTQPSPGFIVGRGKEGVVVEAKLYCTTVPSSGALQMNVTIDGITLLAAPITILNGQNGPVTSTNFVGSPPPLNYDSVVLPVTIVGGGAGLVVLELIVQVP